MLSPDPEPTTPEQIEEHEIFLAATKKIEAQIANGKKYKTQPHVIGLQNLGNTCFMNSVLQVLIHTPFIAQYFSQDSLLLTHVQSDPIAVAKAFETFYKEYYHTNKSAIAPRKIHQLLDTFFWSYQPGAEGDAHEFLSNLISALSQATNTIEKSPPPRRLSDDEKESLFYTRNKFIAHTDYSFIQYITGSFVESTLTCSGDKTAPIESKKYELALNLLLPIGPPPLSIKKVIDNYQEKEKIDVAQNFNCKGGFIGKEGDTIQKQIYTLPITHNSYFWFSLNRFDKANNKIGTRVKIPKILELHAIGEKHPRKYQLYATIHHSGGTGGGHYYARIQHQGNWYIANDSIISSVTEETALESAQEDYLFFYQEVPTPPFQN